MKTEKNELGKIFKDTFIKSDDNWGGCMLIPIKVDGSIMVDMQIAINMNLL
jgi:hypothetical protein